jgi:hypothetical protein
MLHKESVTSSKPNLWMGSDEIGAFNNACIKLLTLELGESSKSI